MAAIGFALSPPTWNDRPDDVMKASLRGRPAAQPIVAWKSPTVTGLSGLRPDSSLAP